MSYPKHIIGKILGDKKSKNFETVEEQELFNKRNKDDEEIFKKRLSDLKTKMLKHKERMESV
jgi:hypothetical protein